MYTLWCILIIVTLFRVLLVLLGFAVVTSTLHEIWKKLFDWSLSTYPPLINGQLVSLWHSFSMLSNGKRILSTKTSPSHIPCLDGLRFLTTTWIIILNTHYVSLLYRTSYNMQEFQKVYNKIFLISFYYHIKVMKNRFILHYFKSYC